MIRIAYILLIVALTGLLQSIIDPFDLNQNLLIISKLFYVGLTVIMLVVIVFININTIKKIKKEDFILLTPWNTRILGIIIPIVCYSILLTSLILGIFWDNQIFYISLFVLIFLVPPVYVISRFNLIFYNANEVLISNLFSQYRVERSKVESIKKVLYRAYRIRFIDNNNLIKRYFYIETNDKSNISDKVTEMIQKLELQLK